MSRHVNYRCKEKNEKLPERSPDEITGRLEQLETQLADLSTRPTVVSVKNTINNTVTNHNTVAGEIHQLNQAEHIHQPGQATIQGHAGWPAKWGSVTEPGPKFLR